MVGTADVATDEGWSDEGSSSGYIPGMETGSTSIGSNVTVSALFSCRGIRYIIEKHVQQSHTLRDEPVFRFFGGGAAAASARRFRILSSYASQCLHVFWCRLKGPGFSHFSVHGLTQA